MFTHITVAVRQMIVKLYFSTKQVVNEQRMKVVVYYMEAR